MAAAQTARTHCPRGHVYDAVNTCYSGGRRHCLACAKDRRASAASKRPSREDRVLAKIARSAGCWTWTGYIRRDGYGTFGDSLAHRLVYELLVGPIPEHHTLDHLCRNRSCVNPAHLEPATIAINVMRGESGPAVNARRTHCPQGHAYDRDNTYVNPNTGWRLCRACNRERQRREGALPG